MSPASLVSTGTGLRALQAGANAASNTRAIRVRTRIVISLGFRPPHFVALLDRSFLLDLGRSVGISFIALGDAQDLGPRDFLAVADDQDLLAGLQREAGVELDEHAVRLAHELDLAHPVGLGGRRILRRRSVGRLG